MRGGFRQFVFQKSVFLKHPNGHSFIINFCTGSGLENPQGPSTSQYFACCNACKVTLWLMRGGFRQFVFEKSVFL